MVSVVADTPTTAAARRRASSGVHRMKSGMKVAVLADTPMIVAARHRVNFVAGDGVGRKSGPVIVDFLIVVRLIVDRLIAVPGTAARTTAVLNRNSIRRHRLSKA
jgi:hypothetical protein